MKVMARLFLLALLISGLYSCGNKDDDPDKTAGSDRLKETFGSGFGATDTLRDVAIDKNGSIYVTTKTKIYRLDQSGNATLFAGGDRSKVIDGKGTSAAFNTIDVIAFDEQNNIYMLDSSCVRKVATDGTVTRIYATNPPFVLDGRGYKPFEPVRMYGISAVNGDIYVQNPGAIMKIHKDTDTLAVFAGKFADYDITDGRGGNARFKQIGTLVTSPDFKSIYVGDVAGIRKVTLADSTVTTITGGDKYGIADGSLKDATFNNVGDLAIDASGNIYVADVNRIRKISSGQVTTIAGPYKPDNTFLECGGIAIDKEGKFLYVVDMSKAGTIIKIDLSGI